MAKYSDDLFNSILLEIATTSKGLQVICKDKGLTNRTFHEWISTDEEKAHRYARAREEQAELLADEMISIADDGTNDTITAVDRNGEPIDLENKEWTSRSKLRIETRKWIAAKLKPKKYGDKIEIDNQISVNKLPEWLTTPISVEQETKKD